MATTTARAAHPLRPVEEMVNSLKLDRSFKSDDTNLTPAKDGPSVDTMRSTNGIGLDEEALVADQSMYYYSGYHYPGRGWNEHGYMAGADGLEMQKNMTQADVGSLVYYMPGFRPGYNSSYPTSLIPGAMVIDGQYLGQQPCVTSPIAPQPQPLGSSVYYPPSVGVGYGPEVTPTYGGDTFFWNFNNGNGYMGSFAMPTTKPKYSSQMQPSKATANSKSSPIETKGSFPVLELPLRANVPNPPIKPLNKTSVPSKGFLPVTKLPPYSYQGEISLLHPSIPTNKENGRNWVDTEKIRARNKFYGFGNPDLHNEQNHGPRTNTLINTSISEDDHAGVSVTDLEGNHGSKTVVLRRDDYNLSDFPSKYEHASFFVIKSYSEDDIHKSIKYNVWASTLNGNKILDSAFQTAQEKMREKKGNCPIFLFFSVNASGQFCGVAEMIGRVDFSKNMAFWLQDKWNGFFPVKWHIIKDVPNPLLRHIKLENNDYKPVTNSRDTQEVKFPQGSEMLKVFKAFSNKTSILDDFGFYEKRQRVMQDKRTKICAPPKNMPKKDEETKESEAVEPIVSALESLELGSVKMNGNECQPVE